MEYDLPYTDTSESINGYEPGSCSAGHKTDLFDTPDGNSFREFYSIGIDTTPGLKEKIVAVHGSDSPQAHFVGELEDFLGDSATYRQASHYFEPYVQRHIYTPYNTQYLVNEFINAGYIAALERLGGPGSARSLDYYRQYAAAHDLTTSQAFLFGPNGTARQALHQWQKEELLRGQHRGRYRPENQQMAKMYDKALLHTCSLPESHYKEGDRKPKDLKDDQRNLPEGLESEVVNAWGREKSLSQSQRYKGTKRLSGDLPYQLIEALSIERLSQQKGDKSNPPAISPSKLEEIIEEANRTGQDVFLALYNHIGKKEALQPLWDQARKRLNDYAELLWRQRDNFGKEVAVRARQELPGTIYLNNGRYYWLPKQGEKAVPLVPEKEKNKLPGSLYKNTPGGYFWWIPHLKFRRRMVCQGQKTATKDLATAQKLQRREWENIQKYEPKLAETLKRVRPWGVATQDKSTAVKIAKKLWRQMQQDNLPAVTRIRSDKRPEISQPNMDKVWPGWSEQQARLIPRDNPPQIPMVYPPQNLDDEWQYGLRVPKPLETIVEKIKTVDWLVRDGMLVFEETPPAVSRTMAIQSRGRKWTQEQATKGKRLTTQGATSLDKDTGRIRFTVYAPGYDSEKTLAEEVYHVVYKIIQETHPKIFKAIQRWHNNPSDPDGDSTLSASEAFSQAMAAEELGHTSAVPRRIVRQARKIFSPHHSVSPTVMQQVKKHWSQT